MPKNIGDYRAKVTGFAQKHARVTGFTANQERIMESILAFRSSMKVFCQTIALEEDTPFRL
ncbi:MAG TPA: hypothetical protein EYQ69_00970 [Gemmatimonadetes bacterium]|nr:hypothetical protein [Gemmatimonadota bacterium]